LPVFKWALQRGYQYVFEMDADFSHDPKYLPAFCTAIARADLVIGSRYIAGVNVINWPMRRLLLSYYANAAFVSSSVFLCMTHSRFKCFRRTLLQSLDLDGIGSSGTHFRSKSIT